MAEQHDADADREEDRERHDGPGGRTGPGPADGARTPIDEEAAWAAIVAAYEREAVDPPGREPLRRAEDPAENPAEDRAEDPVPPEGEPQDDGRGGRGAAGGGAAGGPVLGGSVVFAPGVGPGAPRGPRDYEPADGDDEGHFVPPEPPPLPEADPAAKFGWLGVIGGPVLMLLAVLLGWDMTWWLATLCVGGFLGGFATLVTRMRDGDEDDDDPGRGAVV
ncbi:hypothetical protein [Streptomyces sudanensis]|uniref:hypothetical protein n=1 Tax=Streptomyces sudanensis TaxID=436397 RepID=UPI0020CF7C69|nr:hypothetical protein [Streptomyces sudanensis]MCQ0000253.1 hypothetical protein [Streptomyces sudanensis]